MAFQWNEFFKLASFLSAYKGDDFSREAALRTAMSRAYYSAFCSAAEYARQRLRFQPSYRGEDHVGVITHFRNRGMGDIAENLDRLRQWRTNCDYRPEASPYLEIEVESALLKVQTILSKLV